MRLATPSMKNFRGCVAAALCFCLMGQTLSAQTPQQAIAPIKPTGSVFIRPYEATTAPPVRLTNSPRLRDLVRAGKIYLTVQDAIALAIENDIDLESARYNPLIDQWNLERFEAGGALPGVPSASSQAGTVASGQGVLGSQSAAGAGGGGGNQSSGGTVGAQITQIGPVTPTLDPVFQSVTTFSHLSLPQSNTTASIVSNLIQNTKSFNETISQGLITGGQISLSYTDSYLNENAPSDLLNPSSSTSLSISLRHNFLQGFGVAVNSRNITVAKNTVGMDNLTFKSEVISIIGNVLGLYYGLVADYQDLKAKQSALAVAQRFYEDNKKQVQVGTMAPLDVVTAEAQVASTQQDLIGSETTLAQQQLQLKNVLSRDGLADPLVAEADIVPLDRIDVPEQDNLPPTKDLVATALINRPDLTNEKTNLANLKISDLGSANALLPTLNGIANASNQGLSGAPRAVPVPTGEEARALSSSGGVAPGFAPCPASVAPSGTLCEVPDPYFVGGIGTALGQTIRRNFPSQSAGGFTVPTLRNRQAQSDYAIDQLTYRQSQLQTARDMNELVVDVSNQVTAVRQARVRYSSAVKSRVLEQQLLDAEQKKFSLGASTTQLVVQQQRDLATAQSTEVAALAAYSNARVALNQTLGTTLQANNVSLDEALSGHVQRRSALPASLPAQP
ncbi:MAG: TolC family protein [Acidobacteriaceae bacterium]|nr:TolC family protein [Acidobacteriaceae bacterium]